MPVTFGSVGDIVSVTLLIKDLVVALDDCRGSAQSFQQLSKHLQSLERALLQVDLLVRKHEATLELNALCVAAREAACACRSSAEPFLDRVKEYQRYLKPGGSGNLLKDAKRKIQWKALRKEKVDKFYAQITAHTSSLEMLLIVWSMSVSIISLVVQTLMLC